MLKIPPNKHLETLALITDPSIKTTIWNIILYRFCKTDEGNLVSLYPNGNWQFG